MMVFRNGNDGGDFGKQKRERRGWTEANWRMEGDDFHAQSEFLLLAVVKLTNFCSPTFVMFILQAEPTTTTSLIKLGPRQYGTSTAQTRRFKEGHLVCIWCVGGPEERKKLKKKGKRTRLNYSSFKSRQKMGKNNKNILPFRKRNA